MKLLIDIPFTTAMSELALYRLLTFHVPNLVFISSAQVVYPKNPSKSEALL
jgi:hypothetical protein